MKTPIPVTDHAIPYTPPALLGRGISFDVKPLAPIDYELLSLQLFHHGLQPKGIETQRTMLLDELFKMRLEGKSGADLDIAEENVDVEAQLIEDYWEFDAAHAEAYQAWGVRDRERMRDIDAGADPLPPEPKPVHRMSTRKKVAAKMLIDELLDRPRVKNFIIEDQRREMNTQYNICRLVLLGWTGLKTQYFRDGDIIPDEVMREMSLECGTTGFSQLRRFVMDQEELTAEDVGNSGSPPDTVEDQTGSDGQSDASESSDGSSMSSEKDLKPISKSSTDPTPSGE